MVKTVPLHGKKAAGRVALVSDRYYAKVMRHRWWVYEVVRDVKANSGPYAFTDIVRGGKHHRVYMHTLITGFARVDHRNHQTLDNQWHNLRDATTAQNQHNRYKALGCTSQFKGVGWSKVCQKWRAYIKIERKDVHLGVFKDEVEAARAYNVSALEAFGPYALLNDIPEEADERQGP